MKLRTPILLIFLATIVLTAGWALAKGRGDHHNDALAPLAVAKISLVQAVATAETHVQGRATRAELELEKDRPLFEIEVVDGQSAVYDIEVDAISGQLLNSRTDIADEKDEDDEDQND